MSVGLLVHPYRAQQASRYTLTAAIVERGTVILDDYEGVLGRDRAVRNGHIYSDKAPGQPFLMIPFYAAARAAGVDDATTLQVNENLGLWWLTFWSSAVPGAALAVMMYRRARSLRYSGAMFATVAVFAGTLLLPFSSVLFGHVLAAAFLYASYVLLVTGRSWRYLLASGAASGLAVAVEYTAVLGVAVLACYAGWRYRRDSWSWLAGGFPMALVLALYNAAAFGGAFTFSYQYSAFDEISATSRPVGSMIGSASIDNLLRLILDGRGLLLATPVVIVGLVGAVSKVFRKLQLDALIALAMVAVFVWIPVVWANPWGGDSPGARYVTPALPFLVLPVMWGWERWPRVTSLAAAISVLTMAAATVTNPLLPRDSRNGLNTWMDWLLNGKVVKTVPTIALGHFAWLPHVALLILTVLLMLRAHRSQREELGP